MRLAIYAVLVFFGLLGLIFVDTTGGAFALIGGLVTGLSVPLIDQIVANGRNFRLTYYTIRYRRAPVRISFSYLFRIKVDDKYLLIKGKRFPQYQPVGGVYKSSPGARDFLDKVGASPDTLVAADGVSRNDLRLKIDGRHLFEFVRWFESGRARENSPWREFYEELVEPGILPADIFPYIFHDYLKREIRPIRYSPYAQSLEFLVADIYELLPTAGQREFLEGIVSQNSERVVWVSRDQIERRGAIPGQDQYIHISDHSSWVL